MADHVHTLITAPVKYPVTLAEGKAFGRVSRTYEDSQIDNFFIPAATDYVQNLIGRQMITATYELRLRYWPSKHIVLPMPPLQSVTSVKYYDSDGVEQTWSSAEYDHDIYNEPGRIEPAYSYSWPTARDQQNAITVRYVAGYGDSTSDVPIQLRLAVLQLALHWFTKRDMMSEKQLAPVPVHFDAMCRQIEVHQVWAS